MQGNLWNYHACEQSVRPYISQCVSHGFSEYYWVWGVFVLVVIRLMRMQPANRSDM